LGRIADSEAAWIFEGFSETFRRYAAGSLPWRLLPRSDVCEGLQYFDRTWRAARDADIDGNVPFYRTCHRFIVANDQMGFDDELQIAQQVFDPASGH
jgi:hypothetical protein